MLFFSILASTLATLPACLAVMGVSTIYWPIHSPNAVTPWSVGQDNVAFWEIGGGSGVPSYDVILVNYNKTLLNGSVKLALRYPMKRLPFGRKNFGGQLTVNLGDEITPGTAYRLYFTSSLHGQVFARSEPFEILASLSANETSLDLPTATVTATVDNTPNPTQQWALTLDGIDPDALETSAAQIAGNAGSGGH